MNLIKLGLIGALVLVFISQLFSGNAKADQMQISFAYKMEGVTRSSIVINHTAGATEDFDYEDAEFSGLAPAPSLDIFSKTDYLSPGDRLTIDSRPPESLTTINAEIRGRGLINYATNNIKILIGDYYGENIFAYKNIIGDLYDSQNNFIASYDLKDLASTGTTIPVTIVNGLSYKFDVNFYHVADCNHNREVDLNDFSMLSKYWLTTGHDSSDNWAEGADIDRNGVVDSDDLIIFSNGWLCE